MYAKSLITTSSADNSKKKSLQKAILKKRARLAKLVTKNELLRIEIDLTKREHHARVGSLYIKDNHLDLEIIHYKNILHLMNEGKTFAQAVEQLTQTFYAKQLYREKEEEQILRDAEVFRHRENETTPELLQDLKKLWRRLIAKFHPDLVQDATEKKHREVIIKQINKAYEESNIEALTKLEQEVHISDYQESTVEKLAEILITIENEIIQQMMIYDELLSSQWIGWKEKIAKARKKSIDVFADIERQLLDDIVKKYAMLNALKADVAKRGKK